MLLLLLPLPTLITSDIAFVSVPFLPFTTRSIQHTSTAAAAAAVVVALSLVMLFWFRYIFIHCAHFIVNNFLDSRWLTLTLTLSLYLCHCVFMYWAHHRSLITHNMYFICLDLLSFKFSNSIQLRMWIQPKKKKQTHTHTPSLSHSALQIFFCRIKYIWSEINQDD